MTKSLPTRILSLLMIMALAAGCASVPANETAVRPSTNLEDEDADLMFATEFPVVSKDDALSRADMARRTGKIDKALYFYVKALEFAPEDADLLAAIGFLHQYRGNTILAVRAYTLALNARNDFAEVYEARGLILLANQENERAAADLARAVSLEPNKWRSHNGLGLLADRDGDHVAAIAHYDAAIALNPDSGAILNNRGYSRLLAGQLVGAEEDLRQAATVFNHEQAWVNLGTLYARQGRYDVAVASYEEVLPKPEALNKVAEASMVEGDRETALYLLEQAIRLSPTYFPAAEENLAQLMSLNEER
jgi:Flp pilus assembly protein TadD